MQRTEVKEAMKKSEERIREYVLEHIEEILKRPRAFLRYPFIDPGSVYDGNLWDWDSYWSVYGLLPLMDYLNGELQERVLTHAKGNVLNFFDHQLEDGYIPMMIEVGRFKEPYLNTKHKEGVRMNMHKPFLCSQICLISGYTGDYEWAMPYINQLHRYFECYRREYFHEKTGLYVWANDIMIGVDNDPATFGKAGDTTANIFLNSFMIKELEYMAALLEAVNAGSLETDGPGAAEYSEQARQLRLSVQAECWDERDSYFYTVDVDVKTRSYDWFHKGLGVFWNSLPIRIRSWSGLIPLYVGAATEEQAEKLAAHVMDKQRFASPYGITTLARNEKMFDLSATNNPSNWLGPVWIVANYVVFHGLMRYGYRKEAETICKGTLELLDRDLRCSGQLHEYYNPDTGEPVMNGGFLNWNLLALNMYAELQK